MAVTNYGTNNPLAVKLWSKMLAVEALKATWIFKFIGESTSDMIQIKDETSKSAGDQVTFGLRMQLTGNGTLGDGTLEGNEESLTTYTDALIINQLRHAVRSQGRMSQQRVPFSVRDEALSGLRDWWADRLDWGGFNQLCGNVGPAGAPVTLTTSDIRWTGLQATIAPDANHYTNAQGGTNDTSLGSTNIFTLTMIDKAVERAKTLTPAIRPVMVKGKKFYVCWLHPYQVTDLRTNTASGQFMDIQKAAMTGGEVQDNPIFTGALGVYNQCILHEDTRVSTGAAAAVQNANVRRAVMCGAQSLTMGFGRDNGPNRYTWVEELFDYENELGVAAGTIFGMKKAIFNAMAFGVIVTSSYAVSH